MKTHPSRTESEDRFSVATVVFGAQKTKNELLGAGCTCIDLLRSRFLLQYVVQRDFIADSFVVLHTEAQTAADAAEHRLTSIWEDFPSSVATVTFMLL